MRQSLPVSPYNTIIDNKKLKQERLTLMKKYKLWASSYTENVLGKGIYSLTFDEHSLNLDQVWGNLVNPSYLQPISDRIFAIEETSGKASVIELLPNSTEWKRWEIPGSGLCHITASQGYLYVSGYAGGCLTGWDPVKKQICCYLEHEGHGPNPDRQTRPHIHSALPSPQKDRLFVADLGLDRLYQYQITSNGMLTPFQKQPYIQVKPGQGPRHFTFHPDGQWLYLVTELDVSLLVYRYHTSTSMLEYIEEHSMLRFGCHSPETSAADIHVSPDGRFVYASVRGDNRIFCYQVTDSGLKYAGDFFSGGKEPRSFHLSPDGKYLATANQISGNITIFPLSKKTGALQRAIAQIDIPLVSCVKWATI